MQSVLILMVATSAHVMLDILEMGTCAAVYAHNIIVNYFNSMIMMSIFPFSQISMNVKLGETIVHQKQCVQTLLEASSVLACLDIVALEHLA